jgi:hypothetical protein
VPKLVGDACHERGLGPHHDEVDSEAPAEPEEPLDVVCTDGMAGAELGDARITRRRVELAERWALNELPCERVLAASGPDDEDVHRARV